MKRAPLVIGSTALGLGGVLGFHAQKPSPAHAVTRTASAPATTTTRSKRTPTTAAKSATTTRSATGENVPNQYGDVQVRVTVAGGKVTAVTALALPQSDPKSQEISASAAPALSAQALSAQSAQIDGVSGASYTSEGYKTSLQSALDKLGVKS
jgi:uncharacterized protein with FMN-binding domain